MNNTPRAQQVLALARKEANARSSPSIDAIHVLWGLIKLEQGVHWAVWERQAIDLDRLRDDVVAALDAAKGSPKSKESAKESTEYNRIFEEGERIRKSQNLSYHGTEHQILALLTVPSNAQEILKSFGITFDDTETKVMKEIDPDWGLEEEQYIELVIHADSEVADDTIIDATAELCKLCDLAHRSLGGKGLTIRTAEAKRPSYSSSPVLS